MNLAQLIDPQWVRDGCLASNDWRARHVGVLHVTTVVNGISAQRPVQSAPTRADAAAHLEAVRREQRLESAASASAAAAATRACRQRGLTKTILAVLSRSHQRMALAQVREALDDETRTREAVSSMLSYLCSKGLVDRTGEPREFRFGITARGRAQARC